MGKILIIIAIFTAINANAQWIQTTGPERGYVNCIVASGNELFAGTYNGGVFRLNDFRKNWFESNTGLTCMEINALSVMNPYLFACTAGGGVFRSSDNGGNWTAMNDGLYSLDIVTCTGKDNNLYIGTQSGIYLSTNNGVNWTPFGLTGKRVQSITFFGSTIYAGTSDYGIFCSSDNGLNWITRNTGLYNISIVSIVTFNGYIFAGTKNGLYRSTNEGANWFSMGYVSGSGNKFAIKGNVIFASYKDTGLVKSTNNGINWTQIPTGFSGNLITTLYTSGTDLFYGTYFGIYRSSDNGQNWNTLTKRFANDWIISMLSYGPYIFAGTENNGLFRSSDVGLSWNRCNIGGSSIFAMVNNGTKIFAGSSFNVRMFVSTNNGDNWTVEQNGLTCQIVLSLHARNNCIIAGTTQGVFRTIDNGNNWTQINNGIPEVFIYAVGGNNSYIFAGAKSGYLYRSSDNGLNWISIDSGFSNHEIRSILADSSNIYVGTQDGVYFSPNNGDDWEFIGLANCTVLTFHKIGNSLYAGTSKGVFLYYPSNEIWQDKNQGFSIVPRIYCLLNSQNYILAGTAFHSVWRRLLEYNVGINPNIGIVPDKIFLSQNFPNPFNPETRIRYSLPRSSFVNLVVYDALGREVQNLVNNEKQESGTYETIFDASLFSSGVYYYRLTAEGYSETRKMVVIK